MIDVTLVYPFLKRFALRLTGGDATKAEDLTHDTVVRILEKQDAFDGTNLQVWSGKVMFNLYLTSKRHTKYWYNGNPEDIYNVMASPARQEDLLYAKQLREIIEALPPTHRYPLLYKAAGDTYEDIAQKLGIKLGTVRSRVHRAKNSIHI